MPHRVGTFVLLALCILLGTLQRAETATYYVAPSGGGACSTNSGSPQGGLLNALACLGSGDTLILKSGTYNTPLDNAIPSGSAGAPTVLRAEVPRGAVLTPGGICGTVSIICFGNQQFITMDGLTLDGAGWYGVHHLFFLDYTATNITFQNGEIKNGIDNNSTSNSNGVSFAGHDVSTFTLRGTLIHDIGTNAAAGQGFYAYGIYFHANNSLIENNTISHCSGYAIHFYNTLAGSGNNNTFRNNILQQNAPFGGNAHTMLFADGGDNNTMYNNVLYAGGGEGVIVNAYGTQGHNNSVYNNTIVGHSGACIRLGYPVGTTVRNNLCFANGADTIAMGSSVGTTSDTNLCTPVSASCTLYANPQFVDLPAGDLHLGPGSPVIGQGANLQSLFTTDAGGTPRVAPWDLGAWKAASGGLPAPTNVRLLSVTNP